MADKVRPAVEWFAIKMEERLKDNDSKGGWKNYKFPYLLAKAKTNLDFVSILQNDVPTNKENLIGLAIKDCADCANYCMMIADNLREHKEKESK